MKKSSLNSAIRMEIDRITDQLSLLKSSVSALRPVTFQISIPLSESDIDAIFANDEFSAKGVYVISFEKASDASAIVRQLENYRSGRLKNKENAFLKEAVVRSNDNKEGTTLYVGKIRSMTFKRRLRQHLIGGQNHQTTSIRLIKWLGKSAPRISSKKLVITLIPVSDDKLTRVLEKAIWNYMKPILGDL